MRFPRTFMTVATGVAVAASACSSATTRSTTIESGGDVAMSTAAVVPATNNVLPTGATLHATLDQALGTKISEAGDRFSATVTHTLRAQDNSIVVPAGAKIEGRVTATDDSDNATEPALIRLDFERLRMNGTSYPFSGTIVQSNAVQTGGQSNAERNRQLVIGGVVGAALGGLLSGGDLDKIVIGGALGAAAGSVISLGTEVNATLPAGSQLSVRATEAVALR